MKKTGEWGEFFPSSLSPFGYNETVANDFFPLSKEEATKQGFKWKEKDPTELTMEEALILIEKRKEYDKTKRSKKRKIKKK